MPSALTTALLSTSLLAGVVCDFEDDFEDSSIDLSHWIVVEDTPGSVSVTQSSGALQFTFGTKPDAGEEYDIAGVMSTGWSIDMTQAGGLSLGFVDTAWPSGNIDSIHTGLLLFDPSATGEDGEPIGVLEIYRGVVDGSLVMRAGAEDETQDIAAADLATFDDSLYIWWEPDVGLWFGWSLLEPINGAAWDDIFPDGVADSLGLALFGANAGLTETFGGDAGFTGLCVLPSDARFPDLCAADVYPDYEINTEDVYSVLEDWGTDCTGCREDVNDDGHVNMLDLIDVLAAWGDCMTPG